MSKLEKLLLAMAKENLKLVLIMIIRKNCKLKKQIEEFIK